MTDKFKVYSIEVKFVINTTSSVERLVTSTSTWKPKPDNFKKIAVIETKCESSSSLGLWAIKKVRLEKKRFTHNWFMTVKTTRGQYIYHNFKHIR